MPVTLRGLVGNLRLAPPSKDELFDRWLRLSPEARAADCFRRALDILELRAVRLVAEKRVEGEWHAWLLDTAEGLAEFSSFLAYPVATPFYRFRFLIVSPELRAAMGRLWLRPVDSPIADAEEAAAIAEAIAQQRRGLTEDSFGYGVTLPGMSERSCRELGLDTRRVTVIGPLEGDLASELLWRRGRRHEPVWATEIRAWTDSRTRWPEAWANQRERVQGNVMRLERLLGTWEREQAPAH